MCRGAILGTILSFFLEGINKSSKKLIWTQDPPPRRWRVPHSRPRYPLYRWNVCSHGQTYDWAYFRYPAGTYKFNFRFLNSKITGLLLPLWAWNWHVMRAPFSLHIVSPKVLDSFQWNVVFILFTNNKWKVCQKMVRYKLKNNIKNSNVRNIT